jgi:hypothetical protein
MLAFATSKLVRDPAHALLSTVTVGPELVQQEAELLLACSNRFSGTTAPQVTMLIDTQRALQGQSALVGSITVGVFPREIALAGTTKLPAQPDRRS